MLGLIMKVSFP